MFIMFNLGSKRLDSTLQLFFGLYQRPVLSLHIGTSVEGLLNTN